MPRSRHGVFVTEGNLVILDCHCHIASHRIMPQKFFKGWARTVKSNLPFCLDPAQEQRIDELLYELNEDPDCISLLKEIDEAGIDRAILLVIDFGVAYGDVELTIEEIHLAHKKLIEKSGRLLAFSNVDPRRGREGLDLFEKAVREWGFSGMKLYPPCGYSPDDRSLFPYYEICRELHLPVLTHIGPTTATLPFRYTQPQCVDDAAFHFPEVNFILGHAAVTHYQDAALLAQYRPNIFLDLSGFQTAIHRNEFRNIINWHLSRGLGRKLLFGTDWPIHRFWGNQREWVEKFTALESEAVLPTEEMNNILGNNLLGILPQAARKHAKYGT
jgi:predicted TIM-barrel fold metal-dependent hydrolase